MRIYHIYVYVRSERYQEILMYMKNKQEKAIEKKKKWGKKEKEIFLSSLL